MPSDTSWEASCYHPWAAGQGCTQSSPKMVTKDEAVRYEEGPMEGPGLQPGPWCPLSRVPLVTLSLTGPEICWDSAAHRWVCTPQTQEGARPGCLDPFTGCFFSHLFCSVHFIGQIFRHSQGEKAGDTGWFCQEWTSSRDSHSIPEGGDWAPPISPMPAGCAL